jgi:transcriptional regulator with XRE-family HTH domain
MQRGDLPYKNLGDELVRVRKRMRESLAEVSGAVEITDDKLLGYERGETRPSEDILELLITHFNLRDEESDKLWELAGYNDKNKLPLVQLNPDEVFVPQPAVMLLPLDARIVYSDSFQVTINQYGAIMSFMQNGGNGQPIAIARVGMSLEHAKRVSETLQQTIATASEVNRNNTKNLPAPKPKKDSGA